MRITSNFRKTVDFLVVRNRALVLSESQGDEECKNDKTLHFQIKKQMVLQRGKGIEFKKLNCRYFSND